MLETAETKQRHPSEETASVFIGISRLNPALVEQGRNGDVPSFHTIHLQIHPPNPRHGQQQPQDTFPDQGANRQPIQDQEAEDGEEEDDGHAHQEEQDMDGRPERAGRRRGNGEEGRNRRAYMARCVSMRIFMLGTV